MQDINEKNNLDYITEVSPEELKGLFFMDYKSTEPLRWVRNPWTDARDLAIHTATMDWSNVMDFRVQSYEDLVQPVNEDGFSEYQCESRNINFVPECQKIEYLFGRSYRIDRYTFDYSKDGGKSFGDSIEKGLYRGCESGLIITDAETTISPFIESEGAFQNPENSYVLLDMSWSKTLFEEARLVLDKNNLCPTWGHTLLQKLLEDALTDLTCDPETASHDAIRYLKELDAIEIEIAA